MRSQTIFLFQVVEGVVRLDGGYDVHSEYVHKLYLNAIKELENKGYKYKDLDDDSYEILYKHTKDKRQRDFKQGKDVQMGYINGLIMNEDEQEDNGGD